MRLSSLSLLLVCIFVACGCGPVTSHGGPVRDHVSFVDNLRGRGLTVEPIGQMMVAPFEVPAAGLAVHGGAVRGRVAMLSFDYSDTDLGRDGRQAAEEDANEISQDLTRFRPQSNAVPLPSGPTHFYRRERVIVLYIGSDPSVLRVLVDLLGAQFAGARS